MTKLAFMIAGLTAVAVFLYVVAPLSLCEFTLNLIGVLVILLGLAACAVLVVALFEAATPPAKKSLPEWMTLFSACFLAVLFIGGGMILPAYVDISIPACVF